MLRKYIESILIDLLIDNLPLVIQKLEKDSAYVMVLPSSVSDEDFKKLKDSLSGVGDAVPPILMLKTNRLDYMRVTKMDK